MSFSAGANGGGAYVSALDVGGSALPSDAVPAQGTAPTLGGVTPPADGAAAPAQGAGVGEASPPVADKLADAIKVAVLDAKGGAASVDTIHDTVNANAADGEHTPRGVVEAKIGEMEKAGVLVRQGDLWALATAARAEIETPAAVVARRAEVLSTLAMMVFPDGNDFAKLEGATHLELSAYMRGGTEGEGDADSGALTPTGFEPRDHGADVIAADLAALAAAGVLLSRSAAEEEAHRNGEEPPTPAVAATAAPADEVDDGEDPESEEEEDEDDDDEVVPKPAAVDARPPSYTFASGMMARLFSVGAVSLAALSVPAAASSVSVAAGAATTERTLFEQRLAAELAGVKEQLARSEAFIPRLRAFLAPRRLEWMVDEVLGKAAPPPAPAVVYFPYTQTVAMTATEKAVILDEIGDCERQIAEIEGRVEGAKLAYNSTKTTAKEEVEELEGKKRALFEMSHSSERTYTVEAYAVLDTMGPVPVNIIRARRDNRILERKELRPSEALAAMAKSQVQAPSAEQAPATPATPAASSAAPAAAPTTTLAASPAPPPDAAAEASARAEAERAATAAAKAPSPVGKIALTLAGLRPYVLEAIVVAGDKGLPRETIVTAVVGITGITQSGSVEALVRQSTDKLIAEKMLDLADGVVTFPAKKVVLGLVVAGADMGLRENDVTHAFSQQTGVRERDDVKRVLQAAVDALVAGDDLARGPLPGDMGNLLWPAGETDPRRSTPAAPIPPPPTGATPTPRRGRGRAAAAVPGTPPTTAHAAPPATTPGAGGFKDPGPVKKKAPGKSKKKS